MRINFNLNRYLPAVILIIILSTLLLNTGTALATTQADTASDVNTLSLSDILEEPVALSEYEPESYANEALLTDPAKSWSAINFIMTLISLLTAMMLLLIFISSVIVSESAEISVVSCIMGVISGIVILILFISTQNLHSLVGLFDEYTLITLMLFVTQLALLRLTFSKSSHGSRSRFEQQ